MPAKKILVGFLVIFSAFQDLVDLPLCDFQKGQNQAPIIFLKSFLNEVQFLQKERYVLSSSFSSELIDSFKC